MSGGEFVGWLFLTSFSFWVMGFGIGSIIKMLNR